MESVNSNPFFVVLFFVVRCLVPLAIMLGVSYLLKRLGLISETPKPPPEKDKKDDNSKNGKGGYAHA